MHIDNMSIRAHRILALEYSPQPTFNCSHESELFDFLLEDERTQDGRNADGVGMVEFQRNRLQEAIDRSDLKLDEGTRAELQADITWAIRKGQDYVMYDCF